MPQATTLTINNGAATPVATNFTPESVSPALSVFTNRFGTSALSFQRIGVSSRFASGKSAVNRAKITVSLPVVSTVNGVSSLAYTLRANVDVVIPDAATADERANLHAYLVNTLANTALIRPVIRDLDPIY